MLTIAHDFRLDSAGGLEAEETTTYEVSRQRPRRHECLWSTVLILWSTVLILWSTVLIVWSTVRRRRSRGRDTIGGLEVDAARGREDAIETTRL